MPGTIVILQGPLGAGKTTLVKGIVRGLGVRSAVSSPTFVLRRRYPVPSRSGMNVGVNHVDAYRLRTLRELYGILDEDIAERSRDIWLIEWGGRFARVFPKHRMWLVRLDITGKKERVVAVERP